MTRAELIRKLAKRSGVPDQETKIFFELFLQKASALLKRGEAVKIKGTGYFQLRQGVIKQSNIDDKNNLIYADLMVFFPMQDNEVSSDESLIFNVPAIKEDAFGNVDSYFSLSIGKPVIPLEGVNDAEYFSPPSGHELKKLIETKVDKLLENSEILNKYTKGNEVLLIEPEKQGNDQFEFEWSDRIEETKPSAEKSNRVTTEIDTKTEFEHLAWGFGDELSKQIEEESIIDSANVSGSFTDDLEDAINLEWNFGIPGEEEDTADIKENAGEIEHLEERSKDTEDPEATNEIENEDTNKFERVQSLTSALDENSEQIKSILDSEAVDDIDTAFKSGMNEDKYLPESDEDRNATVDEPEVGAFLDEEAIFKEEIINKEEAISEERTLENPPDADEEKTEVIETKSSEIPYEEPIQEKKHTVKKLDRGKPYGKKNSSLVFVIALAAIIVVGGALFLFLKDGGLNSQDVAISGKTNEVMPASAPTMVERKYDVPVTYPYPPKGKKEGEGISSGTNSRNENNPAVTPEKENSESAITQSSATLQPQKSIESLKIKDYIIKSSGHYVVQVSSWQSEFMAKKVADRFKDKGYQSTVEKANVKGKGIWYRVKVGNFKTLIDAEQFFKKNQ